MNPQIIYSTQDTPERLAWEYYELKICCDENGNWDYGYSSMGGGGPTMRNGEFKSISNAVNAGIEMLTENAENSLKKPIDMNNTKNCQKQAKKFLKWIKELNQPKLFNYG